MLSIQLIIMRDETVCMLTKYYGKLFIFIRAAQESYEQAINSRSLFWFSRVVDAILKTYSFFAPIAICWKRHATNKQINKRNRQKTTTQMRNEQVKDRNQSQIELCLFGIGILILPFSAHRNSCDVLWRFTWNHLLKLGVELKKHIGK